jgi:hypothetical protein
MATKDGLGKIHELAIIKSRSQLSIISFMIQLTQGMIAPQGVYVDVDVDVVSLSSELALLALPLCQGLAPLPSWRMACVSSELPLAGLLA